MLRLLAVRRSARSFEELLSQVGKGSLRQQQRKRTEGGLSSWVSRRGWPFARTRVALGDSAFDAAQAGGRNLSFDEALNELRQWLQDAP